MGLTEEQAPFVEPYAKAGNASGFKSKGNTALAVKRALSRLGFFVPWEPEAWDKHWNARLSDAAAAWKRHRGLIPEGSNDGSWGRKSHDVMQTAWILKNDVEQPAFDSEAQRLLQEELRVQTPDTSVPNLGPVWPGGMSVLDHDLTHATGGIDGYPAFDDAFVAGRDVIAPEELVVTRSSSSNPGDAFYAEGESGLLYWFGHLVVAPDPGRTFGKGAKLGDVLDHSVGGGPHVHVGIDAEPLIGRELAHHTDYSHGAPTVGEQLAAELD
jgi:hypothetical protein